MKERIYHLRLNRTDARCAILPGDPGRVPKIAARLDGAEKLAQNREFVSWGGRLDGEPVLVCSTGIGGPSAAIAMEELAELGVGTFIRVGTCGGMRRDVVAGDLIVPTGAIRMDGTSKEYLPVEYPAVPDFDVLSALAQAARRGGRRFFTGVVQSKDSFYGQHEPERMPVGPELLYKWQAFLKAGALGSEMECSALFSAAASLGVRAGAVLLCVWNQERAKAGLPNPETFDTEGAIETAVGALRLLIAQRRAGKNPNAGALHR